MNLSRIARSAAALLVAGSAILGVGVAQPASATYRVNGNAYSDGCRGFWRGTVLWEQLNSYTWKAVTSTLSRVEGSNYVVIEHLRVYGRYFNKSGSPNYTLPMYDRYQDFGAVKISNIPGNGFVVDTRYWYGDVVFRFEEFDGPEHCYVTVRTPTV